jgi:hypothetical protein
MSSIRSGNCSLTIVGINTLAIAIAKPMIMVLVINAGNPPISLVAIATLRTISTYIIALFSVNLLTRAGLRKAPRPKQTIGNEVIKLTWNRVRNSVLISSSTNGPIEATGGLIAREMKTKESRAQTEYLAAFINFFPC